MANFNGDGYLALDLRSQPILSAHGKISFRFRTYFGDGVLMYSRGSQGDLLAVQLVDARLLLSVSLGGRRVTTMTCASLLDDNIWHMVEIERLGKEIRCSVDRTLVKRDLEGPFFHLNLDTEATIGGARNMRDVGLSIKSPFRGCIENFSFNRTNLNWLFKLATFPQYSIVGNVNWFCSVSR